MRYRFVSQRVRSGNFTVPVVYVYRTDFFLENIFIYTVLPQLPHMTLDLISSCALRVHLPHSIPVVYVYYTLLLILFK